MKGQISCSTKFYVESEALKNVMAAQKRICESGTADEIVAITEFILEAVKDKNDDSGFHEVFLELKE